jgi:hypothetical protein
LRGDSLTAHQPVPDALSNGFDLVQSVAHKSGKVYGSGSLVLISRIETRTFERHSHTTHHLPHRFTTLSTSQVCWFFGVDASYFFSYVA